MILRQDLVPIGDIHKPHGIRGELSVTLDEGLDPRDLRCIVLEIDGIYVPFFVTEARQRGSLGWLVKVDGIDNEMQAAAVAKHEIFALKEEVSADTDGEEGLYFSDLIGYTLKDTDGTVAGVIEDFDDSTANILLTVRAEDGRKVFVPYADPLLADLDMDRKVITLDLPEGLADLNK